MRWLSEEMNCYLDHYSWKLIQLLVLHLFFFSPLSLFFPIPLLWSFTLYSFLLDHLNRTLVNHLNLHSSTYPIRHLLWLSMNGDGCDCTVQGSSPHKCGQKSCCSAFNVVVAAFLLDISVSLSSSYAPEVHPYHWTFLEGHLSHPYHLRTRLKFIIIIGHSWKVT